VQATGDEVHAGVQGGLSDCEESVRRKILWENSQRLYKITSPSAADEAKRTMVVGNDYGAPRIAN
jgi:hypothetical protein